MPKSETKSPRRSSNLRGLFLTNVKRTMRTKMLIARKQ